MKLLSPKIAQVVVGLPVEGPFDYFIKDELQNSIRLGQRIKVMFNRKLRVGFVIGFKQLSQFKRLNTIISLLDQEPSLDENALSLTKKISEYYGCAWGEAIETYLPTSLRKASVTEISEPSKNKNALQTKESVVLLHDKSQSKRWEYIIPEIQRTVEAGKQVIFLVPEVSCIKNIGKRLETTLQCTIATLDKKLTPKNELEQWLRIKSNEVSVVIGTRSAIFAPAPNLGLIVVDQEEHTSYKQEQSPYYHVQQIALMRHAIDAERIIFVSSAPLAETWKKASLQKWKVVTYEPDQLASMQIIDMNNYHPKAGGHLSYPLQNYVQRCLESRKKILLFMNRRGFGSFTQCNQCGFILKCPRCETNLTFLSSRKEMSCSHCNYTSLKPKTCPECNSTYLRTAGVGIEKLESEVARFYPEAKVCRYEGQSKLLPKRFDVLIATQAILQEKETLKVDLVALINFDAELNRLDFRSANKAFSLLVHLRQIAKERFVVQTRMYDNYCILSLQKMNFQRFYKQELKLRKELEFPPYKHLLGISIRSIKENLAHDRSEALFTKLNEYKTETTEVSDPHPDFLPKLRDKYRYTILLKDSSVKRMLSLVKTVLKDIRKKSNVVVTVNVDP